MSYNIVGSDGSLIPVAGNGGGGAVNSVNGQTGAVELKGSDIPVSETDSSTVETALNNKQNKLSATGNSNTPVFINSNKVPQTCNAYAGGTSLTLNGSSKSGNTASIYAPTTAGTKGYVLTSNGTGAPTWQQNSGGGGGAVNSVNGQDGDVELAFNNIANYSELGKPGQVLAVDAIGGNVEWIDAGGGSGGSGFPVYSAEYDGDSWYLPLPKDYIEGTPFWYHIPADAIDPDNYKLMVWEIHFQSQDYLLFDGKDHYILCSYGWNRWGYGLAPLQNVQIFNDGDFQMDIYGNFKISTYSSFLGSDMHPIYVFDREIFRDLSDDFYPGVSSIVNYIGEEDFENIPLIKTLIRRDPQYHNLWTILLQSDTPLDSWEWRVSIFITDNIYKYRW